MSPKPINDLSILIDEVFYPLLSNVANQRSWLEVSKNDVDAQFQELRNTIAEASSFHKCTHSFKINLLYVCLGEGLESN